MYTLYIYFQGQNVQPFLFVFHYRSYGSTLKFEETQTSCRFLSDFWIFVYADEDAPEELKNLDFGSLLEILRPLRRLRPLRWFEKADDTLEFAGRMWRRYSPFLNGVDQSVSQPSAVGDVETVPASRDSGTIVHITYA